MLATRQQELRLMKIHTIDLLFKNHPQTTAIYLVEGPEGPVLIETGPGSTLPQALAGLEKLGYRPKDIRHVLVTHIHLDHAGAAGWWGRQGAAVYVHPVGAPHLVDPSKLLRSAARIYGDQMDSLWGEVLPLPESQLVIVPKEVPLEINGLTIRPLDTPGHAGHHYTYVLGDIAFTGDAAGIHTPGSPVVDIPAAPPEFNLELWLDTVDRLAAEHFRAIYPTHFGRVDDADAWFVELRAVLKAATDFVFAQLEAGQEHDAIVKAYNRWFEARAHARGVDDDLYQLHLNANPFDMSVTGIELYWKRRKKAE